MTDSPLHYAGFVNILGNANVGKSTLMNALVGEHMSIINRKPQTTRHRILGLVNDDTHQIVFSDTPGRVHDPQYEMHVAMNKFIRLAFEDADLVLFMTSAQDKSAGLEEYIKEVAQLNLPVFLIINKIDLASADQIESIADRLIPLADFAHVFRISAQKQEGLERMMAAIKSVLPEHPPFFPKDQLTDRPERFFVTEIIRQHILELYHEEVPYSCEAAIETYEEGTDRNGPITHIRALIFVNRKSQKAIIIGKGGEAIKRLGIRSRKSIESFLRTHVFLELHVKVKENWRNDANALRRFGY